MPKLIDSGLETPTYGAPGWNHIYNADLYRLDKTLLRLRGLLDESVTELNDGEPIVYNALTLKSEPLYP